MPKNAKYIQEPIFNGKMYFYESDNKFKTTVILIHGVGDDASNIWSKLVPILEKHYKVIYFDLPGFGQSDKGDALYSPKNYAALVKWIFDKYVEGPMYLIGHSMGGAISLFYAGTYPDSLQRLVLIDSAGILHRTAFTKNIASFKVSETSKLNFFQNEIDAINKLIETNLLSGTQQLLPKDLSIILDNSFFRRKLFNSPQKIASIALIYEDFSEKIEIVKVPLFIIWGEKDPIAPLRTGKILAGNIPGSSMYIMPGIGHNPMIDNPSQFNNHIIKFLSNEPQKIIEKKLPLPGKKNIFFNGKENQILEGDYDTIELLNCRNFKLLNINAKILKIKNSWVEIENLFLISDTIAVSAVDSIVTVTGGSVTADAGLSISNSKIDLAGIKITAKKAAVFTNSEMSSTVVFSVSKIKSQFNDRYVHDIIEITKDNPL